MGEHVFECPGALCRPFALLDLVLIDLGAVTSLFASPRSPRSTENTMPMLKVLPLAVTPPQLAFQHHNHCRSWARLQSNAQTCICVKSVQMLSER